MAMRTDCKHYESRTYSNGDTVRRCRIDLAPEAPWRCPEPCNGFELRLVDVAWSHGSLVPTQGADEPQGEGIAELLEAAEEIVNQATPDALAEYEASQQQGPVGRLWRKIRRRD
ncbi:MAG: hypothetical protein JJU45_05605 [Acidimicrobiia bacterium]|nr:hypothetical protein [Acidimicrobiia bacterium]